MVIILWLIIGAIVGWLGARIVGRNEGIVASIVIGIVGAFIGSFIGRAFGSSNVSYMSFTWTGFLWSLIGAIVLSAILNMFNSRRSHV